jgi:DNA-binding GntR family transcriptional regulator
VTLRSQAYTKFIEALASKNLRPGKFITQKQLVELTGFPLGAVRELIPRLEGDGLLNTIDRRGLQIAPVDVSFVKNVYGLRLILEKEAIIQFTRTAPIETMRLIQDEHLGVMNGIRENITQEFADSAQQLDWRFHDAIVDRLDNEIISNVYHLNAIKVRLTYQDRLRLTASNLRRVMMEHLAIIDAAQARDEAAAALAMSLHINASRALALGHDPFQPQEKYRASRV